MKLFIGEVDEEYVGGHGRQARHPMARLGPRRLAPLALGCHHELHGEVVAVTAKTKAWGLDTGLFTTHRVA